MKTEDESSANDLDEVTDWQDNSEQRDLVHAFDLPTELLFGTPPRNDTELHERLLLLDPQDAVSLCHLGCAKRARGDDERALDFFYRASEAAPLVLEDPAYLMADTHRERGNYARGDTKLVDGSAMPAAALYPHLGMGSGSRASRSRYLRGCGGRPRAVRGCRRCKFEDAGVMARGGSRRPV